jgi:putative membrane protein
MRKEFSMVTECVYVEGVEGLVFEEERDHEAWKGIVAGAAGGLAASWVMNRFQELLKRFEEDFAQVRSERGSQGGGKKQGDGKGAQAAQGSGGSQGSEGSEDATVKAAEKVSEGVFDHELTDEEKKLAGPAVHYAFGTLVGALYGGLAEVSPAVARGVGMPFGTAVWLAADEVGVPALGLSKKPTEYPVTVHASALGAHLVYGLTTDLVRRLLLRVM